MVTIGYGKGMAYMREGVDDYSLFFGNLNYFDRFESMFWYAI